MVQTESNTGKGTEILNVLSADNPLTDPNHDALGYAPFARHLADSIGKMSPPDGFVMAVYGAWGRANPHY
jgi:predicted KAP-like P-loop ATPase